MTAYGDDLAAIHDAGFGDFARAAAPGVIRVLRAAGIRDGLVIDVGCGSGILSAALVGAGYEVLGLDWSAGMLRIARRRVPAARFKRASFVDAPLPRCRAVVAVGECLNYAFDSRHGRPALRRFFARVARALEPGGRFVFDLLSPVAAGPAIREFEARGRGWLVRGRSIEDRRARTLTREIICLRMRGRTLRRSDEVHRLRLFAAEEVRRGLESAGFDVVVRRSYGRGRLRAGQHVFFATKRAWR